MSTKNLPEKPVAEPPTIDEIMNSAQSSNWLRAALYSGLKRDPVDAVNDAKLLLLLLSRRLTQVLH